MRPHTSWCGRFSTRPDGCELLEQGLVVAIMSPSTEVLAAFRDDALCDDQRTAASCTLASSIHDAEAISFLQDGYVDDAAEAPENTKHSVLNRTKAFELMCAHDNWAVTCTGRSFKHYVDARFPKIGKGVLTPTWFCLERPSRDWYWLRTDKYSSNLTAYTCRQGARFANGLGF